MNEPRPMNPAAPYSPQRPVVHPPPVRPHTAPTMPGRAVVAPQTHIPTEQELEPISLVEEEAAHAQTAAAPAPKKIVAIGADTVHKKHDWKRKTLQTGTGAVRVKSFHGKYSEQGLEYLDNAINEWLDSNAEVEVKFVTSTVMTFEGKIREPALVLNVWY